MFKPPPLGKPDATGDLQRFPIPRLLFFLLKKGFLGTVTIQSSSTSGRIYFRDGMPCFTDIASSRDVLGRVLLERGSITEQAFNQSLQELARTGQLQGQILLAMGALDEHILVEGLLAQLYRKLNRLFQLGEAQIGIFDGEHGLGLDREGAQVQADTLRVIYHGVRNCFDAQRMDLELDKLAGHVVRLRPGFDRRQPRYGMSEEEAALAAFLGAQQLSVESLLRMSHLSPLQTLMVVYTLWVTEALNAAPDPAAARPRPSPRPEPAAQPRRPSGPMATVQREPAPAQPPRRPSGPMATVQREPAPAPPPARRPSGEIPAPIGRRASGEIAPPIARRASAEIAAPIGRRPSGEIPAPIARPPSGESAPIGRRASGEMTAPIQRRPSGAIALGPDVGQPAPQVPDVEDLARSFSTGLLQAVGARPPSAEISPIPLSEAMSAATVLITPPPPSGGSSSELEPIPVGAPALITPPPPDYGTIPIITPPELGPGALITPPPPDALITPPPPALVTPPPPDDFADALITPPPDEEVDPALEMDTFDEASAAAAPMGAPAAPPAAAPSAPAGRASAPPSSASPLEAPGRRRPSQQIAPLNPSNAQTVMEHKSLLRKAQERLKDQDHFQVLELRREATTDQVKDAYFRLAKLYHPDRCAALGLFDMSTVAEEIFRRINEAHAVLTDATARKTYEEQLEGGGGGKQEAMNALEAEFAFQKGVIFFRKKNFAEALRCFQESYKLNEKEGEHLAWIAWTIFNDPKSNRARVLPQIKEQLLKAIKIAPQNAVCHYYLGEVYLALGDEKRARTCFTRTVEIQDGHVDANRHLRLMQMRREKQDKKDKGLFGGLLKGREPDKKKKR